MNKNIEVPELGKELVKIRNTTLYESGRYKFGKEGSSQPGILGYVGEYHAISSVQFNQLKAKLFNLVEASAADKSQEEALKGLIKGFCNEHYRNLVKDLAGLMYRLGLAERDFGDMGLANSLDVE